MAAAVKRLSTLIMQQLLLSCLSFHFEVLLSLLFVSTFLSSFFTENKMLDIYFQTTFLNVEFVVALYDVLPNHAPVGHLFFWFSFIGARVHSPHFSFIL